MTALLIGFVAGVVSGLSGVGGGIVLVPSMAFFLAFDQHVAQGTSLVAIVFSAAAGTVVNTRHHYVVLRDAVLLGIGGAVSARLAALVALRLDAELLRRLFGVLVLVTGIRMARQALRGG